MARARVRARDPLARELPGWLSGVLLGGTVASLLFLESRRPLRARREGKARHDLRNLALAMLSAATIRALERPLVAPLAARVRRRRLGLLGRLRLPAWLEVVLGVVLLDYTLYVWHVLTHRVPFLWRFHRVHHADLDLEASTAVRFHFAEMALSVPWRVAQVRLLGTAPLALSTWQTATLLAILFHHSNVRLPLAVERRLCRVFMTPRMHGIHHSVVRAETDSNWSTIFSWPDYLHRTQRLDVPQDEIEIGVPEARALDAVRLGALVRMPFGRQRARRLVARSTALRVPTAGGRAAPLARDEASRGALQ
jgi:sterol desaturase/sphingolipid hydroxylase (fatty acid hydroxylase superfamily)